MYSRLVRRRRRTRIGEAKRVFPGAELAFVADAELADLLLTSDRWISRRTDCVAPGREGAARRKLKVDFTPPEYVEPRGREMLLPLFSIKKRASVLGLIARDCTSREIAVLTRAQNAILTYAALWSYLEYELKGRALEVEKDLRRIVDDDANDESRMALTRVLIFLDDHAKSMLDREFDADLLRRSVLLGKCVELLQLVFENSILWTPVRAKIGVPASTILEFSDLILPEESAWSYRRPMRFLGLSPTLMSVELSSFRSARSYHVEVEVPEGISIRDITLAFPVTEGDEDSAALFDAKTKVIQQITFGSRAILYLRNVGDVVNSPDSPIGRRAIQTSALVHLHPRRQGFLSFALAASILIAGLLAGALAFEGSINEIGSEVAATTLLFVPTVLAALVFVPDEDSLFFHLMAGVKYETTGAALAAILAAAGFAVSHEPLDNRQIWIACCFGFALICVSLIFLNWIRALTRTRARCVAAGLAVAFLLVPSILEIVVTNGVALGSAIYFAATASVLALVGAAGANRLFRDTP